MSSPNFLNERQIRELNEIYTHIVRKYKSCAADGLYYLTIEDAKAIAKHELEKSRKGFKSVSCRVKNALAKKIYCENKKNESYIKSRSIRDIVAVENVKLRGANYDVAKLIKQEVLDAYVGWLTAYPADTAYEYVRDNGIFLINFDMDTAKYNELKANINNRRMI
jgi:hypothetical protein